MNCQNHTPLPNIHTVDRAVARDNKMVSDAQAGSPEAFTELHAIYSQRLYKTILAITKSPEDAEDALQETFLRVHLAIHTFEGRSTLYSWLTRIAINSALMVLRKRRATPEILFDPDPDALSKTFGFEIRDTALNPEQVYDVLQRRMWLLKAIHKLSPRLREPVRMQLTEDSSIKEIGRVLNLSEAVIKSRLHRARIRLSAAGDLKAFRCHTSEF